MKNYQIYDVESGELPENPPGTCKVSFTGSENKKQ